MSNDSQEGLRQAMSESVRQNAQQVALTEESRVLLASMLRQEIKAGMKEALDPALVKQFVTVFMTEMRTQATQSVDTWTGSIVRSALKKLAIFVVMGSIVYTFGGWGALAAAGKWFFHDVVGMK